MPDLDPGPPTRAREAAFVIEDALPAQRNNRDVKNDKPKPRIVGNQINLAMAGFTDSGVRFDFRLAVVMCSNSVYGLGHNYPSIGLARQS